MFLFLSDYLDLFLVISVLLLIISVFVLIMISQYHAKTILHLDKQVEYWRQQALWQNWKTKEDAKTNQ
jgi:predicted Holliday junction resolvase-like endonuclease